MTTLKDTIYHDDEQLNVDHPHQNNPINPIISTKITDPYTLAYVRYPYTQDDVKTQIATITSHYKPNRIFTDVCFNTRPYHDRPALQEALDHIRHGDVFVIASLGALGGSLQDLTEMITMIIIEKRASFISVEDRLKLHPGDHIDVNRAVLSLLAGLSNLGKQDTPEVSVSDDTSCRTALTPAQQQEAITLIKMGIPKTVIARRFGISRNTLTRYVHRHHQSH